MPILKNLRRHTYALAYFPTAFPQNRKDSKKSALIKTFALCLAICLGTSAFAQTDFFTQPAAVNLPAARAATNNVKNKLVVQLNEPAMRSYLLSAPMEFRNNGVTIPLKIPMPNGETETFDMVESPVLAPAIAAAHPEIKTYTGNGRKNHRSVIRLSLTPSGFSAIILDGTGNAVYFEPFSKQRSDTYFTYYSKDAMGPNGAPSKGGSCGQDLLPPGKTLRQPLTAGTNAARLTTGNTLTTFRLAMAADAEFVAQNGGTQASGFNAVVAYVDRIKAFYRTELSVDFTLVSGTNLIYTNAATDPYTNNNQGAMLDQNKNNCNAVIGVANYDIGHVWGAVGGSGGGVASLESVCDDDYKGRGVSGEGDLADYAQVFMDQLIFHEMGHQLGMTHSYNSSIPVCTTREPGTSVEPGAGATIMSYGFTCDTDDYFTTPAPQTGPILQLHTANFSQSLAFIATTSCGVVSPVANSAPVVTVPPDYTIPISTPFYLTGSATDADNDPLTYCWEGTNVGTMVPDPTTLANTAQPPFFRSYAPTTSPTRIYPLLDNILDGSNYAKGDKLPSVGIATTHRLTARDNYSVSGGVSFGTVTVTVDGAIGPFLVTSNLAASYPANSSQTVTWSVNGTNAATPNVKISLSTDGGYTWPTVLLASTPNDGSQAVTLPNVITTTARLKVEAIGNIFFDISNSNFTITSLLPIKLSSFEAVQPGCDRISLNWKTVEESTLGTSFELQNSKDGRLYSTLEKINGSGNPFGGSYTRSISMPVGTSYYRLLMIDNGQVQFSKVISATNNCGIGNNALEVYPNPYNGKPASLFTKISQTKAGTVYLRVIDALGREVKTMSQNVAIGQTTIEIKDFNQLAAGTYVVIVTNTDGSTINKKVVKQ